MSMQDYEASVLWGNSPVCESCNKRDTELGEHVCGKGIDEECLHEDRLIKLGSKFTAVTNYPFYQTENPEWIDDWFHCHEGEVLCIVKYENGLFTLLNESLRAADDYDDDTYWFKVNALDLETLRGAEVKVSKAILENVSGVLQAIAEWTFDKDSMRSDADYLLRKIRKEME